MRRYSGRWENAMTGFVQAICAAALGVVSSVSPAAVAAPGPSVASAGDTVAVRGSLVRNHHAVPGQIKVELWPSLQALHALPDGAIFHSFHVGVLEADNRGRFTVAVPTDLPADYVGADGDVDIQLTASDGTSATTMRVTAIRVDPTVLRPVPPGGRAVGTRWAQPAKLSDAALSSTGVPPLPEVTMDVGAQAAPLVGTPANLGVAPAASLGMSPVALRASLTAAREGLTSPTVAMEGCYQQTGTRHGPYQETYATFYGTGNAKGKVHMSQGSTHTVGIGTKLPGAATWSSSGTRSVTSTVWYDSNYTIADANVYNRIWQRYYYTRCTIGGRTDTTTFTQPDGFADGPGYTRVAHVNYMTCSPTFASHSYGRNKNINGAYSGGLNLGFVYLYAQAGWTTSTDMAYYFWAAGRLCGSNGQLWTAAPRVSAFA